MNTVRAELRLLWHCLISWQLLVLLVICCVFLLGATQHPLTYQVNIGQPDDLGADVPLIARFYGADQSAAGRFRWSGARSAINLPGFGIRPLPLQIRILPITPEIMAQVPAASLWANGQQIAPMPLRLHGAVYHVLVPATQQIEIHSPTFRVPSDTRDLGIPVGQVIIKRIGLAWPNAEPIGRWLLVLSLLWLAVRRAGLIVYQAVLLVSVALIALVSANIFDPPRAGLATLPVVVALTLGLCLVIVLHRLLPPIYRRVAVAYDQQALGWLLVLVLLIFVLRYAGKTYPGSMPGDINFHSNRFADLIRGEIFLQAPHRGVIAPYPPALYLLLAPFSLLGTQTRELLHSAAALIDALSPCIVYAIAKRSYRNRSSHRAAVLAAACYTLAPAGMLASWWNFSTYIFAQAAQLVLIAGLLVALQPNSVDRQVIRVPRFSIIAVLLVLQIVVYWSHFSYYLNTSLLLAGATCVVIVLALVRQIRPAVAARLAALALLAQAVAVLLFFSFYLAALRGQASAVEAGTAVAILADRAALGVFIRSLLGEGLRDHMALFPVLLAGCGVTWYVVDQRPLVQRAIQPIAAALLHGTLLISLGFGLLPLVSAANLTTRWLMFALWAIAVSAAPVGLRIWRSGWAGRVLVYTIGLYLVLVSAGIWLAALAWRIRPPEPF